MFKTIKTQLSLIMFLLTTQASAVITVGAGGIGVCDHNNLFDAFDDAITNNDHFIRVTSELIMHDTFIINDFIQITGGYDNCADANNNIAGTNLSQWDGDNSDTVVNINVAGVLPLVLIENFRIFDGNDTGFEGAGGIKVSNGSLTLINSTVESNAGSEGGGIQVTGNSSSLTLQDTIITNNSATILGGGISCNNMAEMNMSGDSVITLNTTNGNGGGIFGSNSCQININNGTPNLHPIFGLNGNIAEFGGGVYLSQGADMTITGDNSNPAEIVNNISTSANAQFEGGGGAFLTDNGTTLTATNAHISRNTAVNFGAGMVVKNSALVTMKRLNTPCWDNDKCSSLSGNRITSNTGNSAAGFFGFGGTGNINQTFISNNQANSRAIFRIDDFASVNMEGNVIVDNVGLSGVTTQSLFEVTGNSGSTLDFFYNTIASNNAFVMFVLNGISSSQSIRIINSIIWDQGDIIATLGGNTATGVFNCNFVHETTTLFGSMVDNFVSNPTFVDSANGDFHLSDNSFAIDLCNENTIQSQFKDLNGKDRGNDYPAIVDLRGTFDAGAYEYQFAELDIIFKNGFE